MSIRVIFYGTKSSLILFALILTLARRSTQEEIVGENIIEPTDKEDG
jgi:hypothetical protein